MESTTNRAAAVKQRAEDLAMELLAAGLATDDPVLAPVCEKLKPFQEKLGAVNRDLIRKGLDLVTVGDGEVEEGAKQCLAQLVEKLHGMRFMFGIF
jgi:hypothetical protein